MPKAYYFTMNKNSGILYIVATPIGNLGDITLRAIETLKNVDLIAAEDTRHSKKLLQHCNINTPTISLHDYNENQRSDFLIEKLKAGKNIALISDAGTPLISDPGYHLVKKVHDAALTVIPIVGACALVAALSAAGLPTEKFVFEGFLPAKMVALHKRLQELTDETRTIILYESPHRLMQLINNLLEIFGPERYVVLAKELTKIYETIFGAKLSEVKKWLEADDNHQKGEFVVLISGATVSKHAAITMEAKKILQILLDELPPKKAVNLTAKITNADKRELYKIAIAMGSANRQL
jgi:16S rRNA (cytidine1402-2'-O)-methyltransferase